MRGVSRWASRIAPLVAVFLVLGAVGAWADEAPPTDPPQARLSPPSGVQSRLQPPVGIAPPPADGTSQVRLNPPVGATARVQPPSGAPMTLTQMILIWLRSSISLPNG
jgi:hypothetical protein